MWRSIRPKLAPYGRLARIESSIELGVPDVYYRLLGVAGWLELKFRASWPTRGGPVTLKTLTIEQVRWLQAERKADGLAWILAQVAGEYLVPLPEQWEALATVGVPWSELVDNALFVNRHFYPGKIVRILTGRSVSHPVAC